MPKYKNGDEDLWNDFYSQFHFNTKGDKSYQIRKTVQFVVNTEGNLVGSRILDNNYDAKPKDELTDLEKAILDTLDQLQDWEPGIENGKRVNILFYHFIPIFFTKNDETKDN